MHLPMAVVVVTASLALAAPRPAVAKPRIAVLVAPEQADAAAATGTATTELVKALAAAGYGVVDSAGVQPRAGSLAEIDTRGLPAELAKLRADVLVIGALSVEVPHQVRTSAIFNTRARLSYRIVRIADSQIAAADAVDASGFGLEVVAAQRSAAGEATKVAAKLVLAVLKKLDLTPRAGSHASSTPRAKGPGPQNPAARRLLEEGVRHYNVQDYAAAIDSFRAGYKIEAHTDFLYAMAQAERLRGNCQAALLSYKAFLRSQPPAAEAERARKNIDRCETSEGSSP